MARTLNLSESIVERVPERRRFHTSSNLRWILGNLKMTYLERVEVIAAYRAEMERVNRLDPDNQQM